MDGQECEALWDDGTLIIDKALMDQARLVEALGETRCLQELGIDIPCRVDLFEPKNLMASLLVALDQVSDVRLALADEPDRWQIWPSVP